jgi:transposase
LAKKYVVRLTDAERAQLTELAATGSTLARLRRRAQLLLDSDVDGLAGGLNDQAIALTRSVSIPTVARVRQLFVAGGMAAVLAMPPAGRQRPTGVSAQQVAQLYTLADSPPPEGARRWSLRQLAEAMVDRQYISSLSHETVRRVLRERAAGYAQPGEPRPETEPDDGPAAHA